MLNCALSMATNKLLMTGLTVIALGYQHPAYSASIETLIMPGQVTEAHSAIEGECSECHAAFSKVLQHDLCLSCHDHRNIVEDLASGTGFHGRFGPAKNVECANCHTEHEGREADIVRLDTEIFNHDFTDFPLQGSHAELACDNCHVAGERFHETPSACFDCHQQDDSHQGQLGEDCGRCHQETSWRATAFDHSKDTEFALTGAHQATACALCHPSQRYEGIPTDCYSCHQIDDQHKGNYGKACEQCHQTKDWKESIFDHAKTSDFPLRGRHSEISCGSCHPANRFDGSLPRECTSCHLADNVHQRADDTDCGACHDSSKWANVTFDHLADTNFPLKGAHKDLDCRSCHTSVVTDLAFSTACFSCHQADDAHQQELGRNCGRCHRETGWTTNVTFDHDLTTFPLIGLHSIAPCEACHLSPRFADAPGNCLDCHGKDDTHRGALGTQCGSCHNPNDWLLWEFEHAARASFTLDGAHTDLACQDCHAKGRNIKARSPEACFDCHRRDDIHSGEFGKQCLRCHNTRTFKESGTIQ